MQYWILIFLTYSIGSHLQLGFCVKYVIFWLGSIYGWWYAIPTIPHFHWLWLQFPSPLHVRRHFPPWLVQVLYLMRSPPGQQWRRNPLPYSHPRLVSPSSLSRYSWWRWRGLPLCSWWHRPQHLWCRDCKHAMQKEMTRPQRWQHSTRGTKCSTTKRHF